jgi:predicted flap endonuclease-1-like 5' DNA nuclease
MKRLARILGVVGGVAAVVWAMRDRLISITAPREPQPPRFRVVTPPSAPPVSGGASDDLTQVVGIGPVFSERLTAAGILTFGDLATAGVDRAAQITGVPVSRAEGWITQAQDLASR